MEEQHPNIDAVKEVVERFRLEQAEFHSELAHHARNHAVDWAKVNSFVEVRSLVAQHSTADPALPTEILELHDNMKEQLGIEGWREIPLDEEDNEWEVYLDAFYNALKDLLKSVHGG